MFRIRIFYRNTYIYLVEDLKIEREDPLNNDCIVEKKVCKLRHEKYEYFT